jgi:putative SOS response-associated peptidase YedK
VVLATHYYEYKSEQIRGKETKLPFKFAVPDQPEFALAGLYSTDPKTNENYASVITVPASKFTETYHDRMPAILPPNQVEQWLSPESESAALIDILLPYPQPLETTPADRAQLAAPRLVASSTKKPGNGNETLDFPE